MIETLLTPVDALRAALYRGLAPWLAGLYADRARRVAEVLRDSEQVRSFTLQQWQQLGKRSLFDVMAAESDHYAMRVAYVNALHDVQQLNANLLSLGRGVNDWLQ